MRFQITAFISLATVAAAGVIQHEIQEPGADTTHLVDRSSPPLHATRLHPSSDSDNANQHNNASDLPLTDDVVRATCVTNFIFVLDSFLIHGKNFDARLLHGDTKMPHGHRLHQRLQKCGIVTDWRFENYAVEGPTAVGEWDFEAKGHLPVLRKNCIERQIVKSGGPEWMQCAGYKQCNHPYCKAVDGEGRE